MNYAWLIRKQFKTYDDYAYWLNDSLIEGYPTTLIQFVRSIRKSEPLVPALKITAWINGQHIISISETELVKKIQHIQVNEMQPLSASDRSNIDQSELSDVATANKYHLNLWQVMYHRNPSPHIQNWLAKQEEKVQLAQQRMAIINDTRPADIVAKEYNCPLNWVYDYRNGLPVKYPRLSRRKKLTEEDRNQISQDKRRQLDIATDYNLTQTYISYIQRQGEKYPRRQRVRKLTVKQRNQIRRDDRFQKDIAADYNVTQSYISYLKRQPMEVEVNSEEQYD